MAGQVETYRLYSVNSQVANNLLLCPNNIISIFDLLGFPLVRLKALKHKAVITLI